jgi:hypothetical protein
MAHSLKALGPVVIAVLAMNVMVASVASAANEFHSAGAPTTITGSHKSITAFHFPGAGSWECTTATFHSSQSATTTQDLTMHPTYSGCKLFGFSTVDTITTGCDYTFTQPSSSKSAMHIVCASGTLIRITPTVFGGSVCTITFGSQSPAGVVDFTNNPKIKEKVGENEVVVEHPGKVLATWTVTGISHSAGCGAEAKADATYTGTILLQGDKGAISVS